ncbi:hypothetical protein [Longimicrobium sp.]|uniref:hypothetical protein n=1 Tax=Longimicrobium sp. TaxID=2029185 RepID=UPI002CBA7239|nr:hypothetical protein [Longimicrobium sp.]HSU15311.1 hypothetical protein [Longimicrobium sp.]
MPRALRTTLALVLLLAPAACGRGGNASANPRPRPPRTFVTVTNRDFRAYTVYVTNNLQRQRLGTVQPVSSATLLIPVSFVQTAGTVRFIADPIGSDAVATTFNINVSPGETVQLSIF